MRPWLVIFLTALLAGLVDLLAQEEADTGEEDEGHAIDDEAAKADTFHRNLLDYFNVQAQHGRYARSLNICAVHGVRPHLQAIRFSRLHLPLNGHRLVQFGGAIRRSTENNRGIGNDLSLAVIELHNNKLDLVVSVVLIGKHDG